MGALYPLQPQTSKRRSWLSVKKHVCSSFLGFLSIGEGVESTRSCFNFQQSGIIRHLEFTGMWNQDSVQIKRVQQSFEEGWLGMFVCQRRWVDSKIWPMVCVVRDVEKHIRNLTFLQWMEVECIVFELFAMLSVMTR